MATQVTTNQEIEQADSDNYENRVIKLLWSPVLKVPHASNEGIGYESPGFDNKGPYLAKDTEYYYDLYLPFNDLLQTYREGYSRKRGSLCAFNAVACKVRKPSNSNLEIRALFKSI